MTDGKRNRRILFSRNSPRVSLFKKKFSTAYKKKKKKARRVFPPCSQKARRWTASTSTASLPFGRSRFEHIRTRSAASLDHGHGPPTLSSIWSVCTGTSRGFPFSTVLSYYILHFRKCKKTGQDGNDLDDGLRFFLSKRLSDVTIP